MLDGLQVQKFSFSYGKKLVIDQVSFHIPPSHSLAILGANGSGKSTLVKCLAQILPMVPGHCFWNGKDLAQMSAWERSRIMAFVSQENGIGGRFSVFDAVLLGRKPFFSMKPKSKDLKMVESVLQEVHLDHLAFQTVDTLSGGQLQLVRIAAALCQEAPLLIMDEPFSNLDIQYSARVLDVISKKREEGKTIVVVLHDLHLIRRHFQEILAFHEGKATFYQDFSAIRVQDWTNIFGAPFSLIQEFML